ncbi:MAG: hypothetical protein IPN89_18660 [Saprospiraceae bacterium]|nr:hypothetical protein [Saprospiraceae bacterium]
MSFQFGIKIDENQLLNFSPTFLRYKKNGLATFDLNSMIKIKLNTFQYVITIAGNKDLKISKTYIEKLTDQEIETIVNEWGKQVVDEIKKKLIKN